MKVPAPGLLTMKLVAAVMLIAALGRHPYGYYTLLRWVVCGVAAYSAARAHEAKRTGWTWTLATVALVFNPLLPVLLDRDSWAPVDVAVSTILIISVFAVDRHLPHA